MIEMSALSAQTSLEGALDRIKQLGQGSLDFGFGELFELLDSSDWQVRRAASEAMSECLKANARSAQMPAAFDSLIGAVAEKKLAGRRAAAIAVLEMAGEAVLPFLSAAMKSAPATAQIAYSGIVGTTGGARAVRLLKPLARVRSDSNVAAAAISALGHTNNSLALTVLSAHVNSTDEWLQFAAVGALGELGDERAIDLIEPLLERSLLQETAALALVDIGTVRCASVLVRHCFSADGKIIERILHALATLYSDERKLPRQYVDAVRNRIRVDFQAAAGEKTLDELLTMLRSTNAERARSALAALGWLGRAEAVTRVIESLQDPALTKTARRSLSDLTSYAEALRAITESILNGVNYGEIAGGIQHLDCPDVIPAAVEIMLSANESEARDLCAGILAGVRARIEKRIDSPQAGRALGRLVEYLLVSLEKARGRSLIEIALTLAALPSGKSKRVREKVLDFLSNSDDPEFAVARLEFTANVNPDAAIREARIAQRHSNAAVRLCAIEILASSNLSEDASSLAKHSTDESAGVRRAAIRAMSRSAPGGEAMRVLRAAANDSDVWVRAEAIRAMGHVFRDSSDIDGELTEALANAHPLCRLAAITAIAARNQYDESAQRDGEGMGRWQAAWKEILVLARRDSQPEVRRGAVLAFINCPIGPLIKRVARFAIKDEFWPVQLAAVELAGKSNAEFTTAFLVSVAMDDTKNPAVRGAAIRKIATLGHPRSLALALAALNSGDSHLVEDGFAALKDLAQIPGSIIKSSIEGAAPRLAVIMNFILSGDQSEGTSLP